MRKLVITLALVIVLGSGLIVAGHVMHHSQHTVAFKGTSNPAFIPGVSGQTNYGDPGGFMDQPAQPVAIHHWWNGAINWLAIFGMLTMFCLVVALDWALIVRAWKKFTPKKNTVPTTEPQ